MCCCGKPVVNGEPGYRWSPGEEAHVRPVNAPDVGPHDTLIYDEPGRCGGLDSHSHHYRVVLSFATTYLLVRHGSGDERVPLNYSNTLKEPLSQLDSNARYWLLNTIYHVHAEAGRRGRETEAEKWRKAAAEKRIKTRKQPRQNSVKVWIE